ncbi:hypothetical protein ACFU6M_20505 [Streptomyces bottropensis]|uniref:Uncharacterized protein n=1 Tax=Streptomyces bottropensis TaxID=42235 RepID=A0ABU8B1L7_9ACTN
MEWPAGFEERVARVDAGLRPLAEAPVDLADPGGERGRGQRPAAMDEAGVRAEAAVCARTRGGRASTSVRSRAKRRSRPAVKNGHGMGSTRDILLRAAP